MSRTNQEIAADVLYVIDVLTHDMASTKILPQLAARATAHLSQRLKQCAKVEFRKEDHPISLINQGLIAPRISYEDGSFVSSRWNFDKEGAHLTLHMIRPSEPRHLTLTSIVGQNYHFEAVSPTERRDV